MYIFLNIAFCNIINRFSIIIKLAHNIPLPNNNTYILTVYKCKP